MEIYDVDLYEFLKQREVVDYAATIELYVLCCLLFYYIFNFFFIFI